MDDERTFKWLWTTAVVAGGLCVVLIVLFYARSRRSFARDFSPPGFVGTPEPAPPAGDPAAGRDVEAPPGEA